jgi:hypothetical protein
VREYCRQNSGHCLTAATIARELGTKITTTRYELYQLRNEHIIVKLGIDQWKYVDSAIVEKQVADLKSAVEAPAQPSNGKPSILASSEQEIASENTKILTPETEQLIRARVLEYLRENRPYVYSTEDLAKTLGTELALTQDLLDSLYRQDLIVKVGLDFWRCERKSTDSNAMAWA